MAIDRLDRNKSSSGFNSSIARLNSDEPAVSAGSPSSQEITSPSISDNYVGIPSSRSQ
ncbi:hypothetical protein VB005_10541 [Metarhizium brunneum]